MKQIGTGSVGFGGVVRGLAVPLAFAAAACSVDVTSEEPTTTVVQGIAGAGGSGAFGTTTGFDTKIVENDSTVYSTLTTVSVRGDGGTAAAMVGLVIWKLPFVPTPCTVTAAEIIINVTSTSIQSFKFYPANREWSDSSANWTFAKSGVAWQIPGALGSSDRGPAFAEFTPSSSGSKTVTLGPTGRALVQSWIHQSTPNIGIIVAHETHSDGFSFASFDHATVSSRPTLQFICI